MTTDPTTAAARLVGGQIDAMKTAAGNTAGAMTGFMGMGMAAGAGGMGGMSAQNLFAMGQQARPDSVDAPQQVSRPAPAPADSWQCSCGATVTGKFCPECGSKKPEGYFDTAPEDADQMCFLPTDGETEGDQLPFTASYITPYPELNVEEADLFYQEGTPEVPFQTNQEWYATFTGEDGSRYAVTLEDENTLALKFYLDGEESYMSLVNTVYFARQEAMG